MGRAEEVPSSVLWKVNKASWAALTKPLLCPKPVHPLRGGPGGSALLVQRCLGWDVSGWGSGGGRPREQLLPEVNSVGGGALGAGTSLGLLQVPLIGWDSFAVRQGDSREESDPRE